MAIHVHSNQAVELRTPLKCPWRDIDAFLASKADWIVQSREYFARQPPVYSPRYVNGERHAYLGEQYRLMLVRGRPRAVEVLNDTMVVRCNNPYDPGKVRDAIETWYRNRAKVVLPQRLNACLEAFATRVPAFRGLTEPSLTIRKMRARWGSCSSSGEICLNSLFVQESTAVIDYVIAHELCHLKHFSHNKPFYRLLHRVMPDWRRRAALLESQHPVSSC